MRDYEQKITGLEQEREAMTTKLQALQNKVQAMQSREQIYSQLTIAMQHLPNITPENRGQIKLHLRGIIKDVLVDDGKPVELVLID